MGFVMVPGGRQGGWALDAVAAELRRAGHLVEAVTLVGLAPWVDLVTSLTSAPFVGIASIRGRTRGGRDEITLAFNLRYAGREETFFCRPGVATGIVPGGGGSDRLTWLLGRDRALEAILASQDFSADTAERYGWVTRAVPGAELDDLVDGGTARIASFDKAWSWAPRRRTNRSTLPPEADLRASWAEFVASVNWPGFQARAAARKGHRRDRP
ncbi:enoyl-CoA hydratase/isomerase family protein [Streptomyces sp. SLBN-8D4]|jgi:enoyl-CoA hydratase/carnithine racemase|uniref:enoyl-CoA hydratase/isomerase family protein n=1 Tax=Streptomyces sp. SLBN-8D4 TaxID=3377728 RepID=UPI003C7ADE07